MDKNFGHETTTVDIDPVTGEPVVIIPDWMYMDLGWEEGDVINYIPALCAGAVARKSGLADASGWCPGDQTTFESSLVPNVYVIGDACKAEKMPKSGFSANSQVKVRKPDPVRLGPGPMAENARRRHALGRRGGRHRRCSVAGRSLDSPRRPSASSVKKPSCSRVRARSQRPRMAMPPQEQSGPPHQPTPGAARRAKHPAQTGA